MIFNKKLIKNISQKINFHKRFMIFYFGRFYNFFSITSLEENLNFNDFQEKVDKRDFPENKLIRKMKKRKIFTLYL